MADETGESPAIEFPPPAADATPEERDRHWLEHIYQGERIPQLTVRAVVMGGVLGMFMAISNLYTTLKLGFYFGVAITSCVLSYVIWNILRGFSGKRLTEMTILENNCMQSTATAAGSSAGNSVGVAFGALLLLTAEHKPWWCVLLFALFTAVVGVFVAVPMKRQFINVEQLPFPSGIAAAVTLRSLHARGREATRKAIALMCALIGGALVGFYRFEQGLLAFADRIYAATFHIVDLIRFGGFLNPLSGRGLKMFGLGFEPGTLMLAAGAFIGLRVSLSMLAGSVILYYVIMPLFVSHDALVFVAGQHRPLAASAIAAGTVIDPRKWALWGGTSVMLFASLAAIAVQWRTVARAFTIFKKRQVGSVQADLAAVEVPFSWVIAGIVPAGLGLIVLNAFAFGMAWWLGLIAVSMSFITALVACRATGETDFTPTGAMGKITQLLYAVLAQGDRVVNLMSAGVTSAASAAAADLLGDLKSGYLLGANPRKQFLAQFCGIFFGVAAIVPAWYLMVPDKAALEAFHPPATEMWLAVAHVLNEGLSSIPVTARYSVVVGGLVGILLPVLGVLFPKAERYLPSGIGLGLSWVVPFQTSLSFAIGATLALLWTRLHKRTAETYTYPIAAGLIAGESIVLALMAMAATAVQIVKR